MGRLARPMLLAGAAAPYVGAVLIDTIGAGGTMMVLALLAAIPVGATLVLGSQVQQARRQPPV